MPTLRELIIKAVFRGEDAGKAAKKFDDKIDKLGKDIDKTAASGANLTNTIKGMVFGFASIGGIVAFTKSVIATNVEAQKLEATITTLSNGNAKLAASNQKLISDFAVTTPFAIGGVTQAWITLKAAGIEPTFETMKKVGDFAAATGTDITRAADAITKAQVGTFSEVTSQLKVSVTQMGDSVKLAGFGMERIVKKGKPAAQALLEMGASFPDAMSNQLETLGGKMSNLGDATTAFRKQVGKAGFNDALIELLGLFIEVTGESEGLATVIGRALAQATRALTRSIVFLRDNMDRLIPVLKVIGAILATQALKVGAGVVLQLASAFKVLRLSVLAANAAALVIPAIIVAIILLVEDLFTFVQGGDSLIGDFLAKLDMAGGESAAFATMIRSVISGVADAVMQFVPVLVSLGKTLFSSIKLVIPTLAKIVAAIAVVIGQLIPVILPIFETIVGTVSAVLEEVLPAITDAVEQILPIMLTVIAALMPAIKGIVRFVAPIFLKMNRWLAKFAAFLIDVGVFLFKNYIKSIKNLVDEGKRRFGPTISRAIEVFEIIGQKIAGFFEFATQKVEQFIGPILKKVEEIREALGLTDEAEEKRAKHQEEAAAARAENIASVRALQRATLERAATAGGAEFARVAATPGKVSAPGLEGKGFEVALTEIRQQRIRQGEVIRSVTEEEKRLIDATRKERLARIERGLFVGNLSEFEQSLVSLRTAKVGEAVTAPGEFTFNAQGISISVQGTTDMGKEELESAVVSGSDKLAKKVNRELAREMGRAK